MSFRSKVRPENNPIYLPRCKIFRFSRRILRRNGFSEEEVENRKPLIYTNVLVAITTVIRAMDTLQITLTDFELQADARTLLSMVDAGKEGEQFDVEVADIVNALWADEGVKRCFDRRAEYQLNDSAKYFIESASRVASPSYVPTEQDLLRARSATTGVVEVTFSHKGGLMFHVFDVGGQRSERRKWIHCFDDVDVILFVVAISEYDQKLREDEDANRLIEAIMLFTEIVNNQFFFNTNIILFFNKRDLFAEKIVNVPLTVIFPNYKGGKDYEQAVEYLDLKFRSRVLDPTKKVYMHETCATDTDQVQKVINGVIEGIVSTVLKSSGLI